MLASVVACVKDGVWLSVVTLGTFPRPTSLFVTLCGLPEVFSEWSYAVLPLSPLYAVELVSPRAMVSDITA